MRLRLLVILSVLLSALAALGHEVRPAYLALEEDASGEFSVVWKTPMIGELRLALDPEISGPTEAIDPPATRKTGSAAVQTSRIRVNNLRGRTVRIAGLENTMTDALVRVAFMDGSTWTQRLTPQQPATVIPMRPGAWEVATTYLGLGVEHILLGIDHLLFVLALLILTTGTWRLVKTVTAFTVAHSITLGLATLGFVYVPPKPVEAVIALSIVFVAAEIVHAHHGRLGLAARIPWLVAFAFGLLHGLGFAGALSNFGLPEGHVPVALLFFNLGVEAAQLMFVAVVLAIIGMARRLPVTLPRRASMAPAYAIGGVASFWMIERVAAF